MKIPKATDKSTLREIRPDVQHEERKEELLLLLLFCEEERDSSLDDDVFDDGDRPFFIPFWCCF
jgi:hypothetical protein